MSRATMGGTKILTRRTRNVPGGMAANDRAGSHHQGRVRPTWADDPAVTLPCQQPDVDPNWWFESGTGAVSTTRRARAAMLCGTCPMQGPCRDQAEANAEPWGMWGGVLREPLSRPGKSARKRGAA